MKLNEIALGSKQHAELIAANQKNHGQLTKVSAGDLFKAIKDSTLSQHDVDAIIDTVGKTTKPTVMFNQHELEQICITANVDSQEIFDLVGMKFE